MTADASPIEQPFGYGPTILGFEVIDTATGRPVTEAYDTAQAANGRAQQLNILARNGDRKALARALRSDD